MKKESFAPTPVRVMAIIQLCLAFSVLMWCMGQPFMGDLFESKSRLLVYDSVVQDEARFQLLPHDEKREVLREYEELQRWGKGSFWEKTKRSVEIVVDYLPPFLQSWILFSIVISLMLLLQVEGVALAAWILPLIVALYGMDNRWNGTQLEGENLFPSEQYLVEHYLEEPLGVGVGEQREQLLKGWRRYLIQEWAKKTPSELPEEYSEQLKEGLFAFNLARISHYPEIKPREQSGVFYQKESPFILILYFSWNLFFAWMVNRRWE